MVKRLLPVVIRFKGDLLHFIIIVQIIFIKMRIIMDYHYKKSNKWNGRNPKCEKFRRR